MSSIQQLLEIMRRLRDPASGCPWDQAQTLRSLIPYTLEEAYEVAETIECGDMDELADELGDLLFQVVFYARIAEESGAFDFDAVCKNICDKLIRRHPHVFADEQVGSAAEQTEAWERHKAKERAEKAESGKAGLLDGVSLAIPAMTRAGKLQKRAARVGFDWPEISGVLDKVREELTEFEDELEQGDKARLEHEIGDLLFAVVNLARHAGVEPESALRGTNRRFERRFAAVETTLADKGGVAQASLEQMDAAWRAAKAKE